MSLLDGKGVSLFPLEFLKQCVATYTKEHGQAPKILAISEEDYIDWNLSCTLGQAAQLGVKVTTAKYLKSGEIDLALGIKDE
jgi:hypothetical protein